MYTSDNKLRLSY